MVLHISDRQKAHIQFLAEQSNEAITEFCKLSYDYMERGPDEKKYAPIFAIEAKKHKRTPEEIQSFTEAWGKLLVDAIYENATKSDLDLLKLANFSDTQINAVIDFLALHKNQDNWFFTAKNIKEERLNDLDWRVECLIASRLLHQQSLPTATVKLHLDSETNNEHREPFHSKSKSTPATKREVLLRIDTTSLVHIIATLESALLESKTHRTRNFTKALLN